MSSRFWSVPGLLLSGFLCCLSPCQAKGQGIITGLNITPAHGQSSWWAAGKCQPDIECWLSIRTRQGQAWMRLVEGGSQVLELFLTRSHTHTNKANNNNYNKIRWELNHLDVMCRFRCVWPRAAPHRSFMVHGFQVLRRVAQPITLQDPSRFESL